MRKIWCDDGSRSPDARAAAETRVDKTHLAAAIRRFRRMADLPATAAAIRAGALSPEVTDSLHDASNVELDVPFSEIEQTLMDACVLVGSREARSVLKRWAAAHDRASDGLIHLNGPLPAVASSTTPAEPS